MIFGSSIILIQFKHEKKLHFNNVIILCNCTYLLDRTMVITGAFDGPLSGWLLLKAIELYAALMTYADLGTYGIEDAANGNG